MMSYLAKCFEKMCNFLAIFILIIGLGLSIPGGLSICDMLDFEGPMRILVCTGCCVFGLLLAFIFDVVTFGFFAQIIQIRKLLEEKK